MPKDVVQFDATVNVTLEVSRSEWESFLSDARDDQGEDATDKDVEEQALYELGQFHLDGSEAPVVDGRFWICAVDDLTKL